MKSKKKMGLPMDQISNPENKNMYLVRAQYSTDRNRRQIYENQIKYRKLEPSSFGPGG